MADQSHWLQSPYPDPYDSNQQHIEDMLMHGTAPLGFQYQMNSDPADGSFSSLQYMNQNIYSTQNLFQPLHPHAHPMHNLQGNERNNNCTEDPYLLDSKSDPPSLYGYPSSQPNYDTAHIMSNMGLDHSPFSSPAFMGENVPFGQDQPATPIHALTATPIDSAATASQEEDNYTPGAIDQPGSSNVYLRVPSQRRLFLKDKEANITVDVCAKDGHLMPGKYTIKVNTTQKDAGKWKACESFIIDQPASKFRKQFPYTDVKPTKNKRLELTVSLHSEDNKAPPLDTKVLAIGVYSNTNQKKTLMMDVIMHYTSLSAVPSSPVTDKKSKIKKVFSKNEKDKDKEASDRPQINVPTNHAKFWVLELWRLKLYNRDKKDSQFNTPTDDDWRNIMKTLSPPIPEDVVPYTQFEKLLNWTFNAGEEAIKVPDIWNRGAVFFCTTALAKQLLNRSDLFLIRFSSAGKMNFAFHQPDAPGNQGEITPGEGDREMLYYISLLMQKNFKLVLKDRTIVGPEWHQEEIDFEPEGVEGLTTNREPNPQHQDLRFCATRTDEQEAEGMRRWFDMTESDDSCL
ncbi:hypothetical protein PROFUN_09430 [Planoprotostelium fungivorum]|uniref:Uncharacterized protein n=1 Tax=Planoprotostelium fungivorum TaxID=1890364 RepID=A0A2P6NHJ2_9EUKA|nr:hypothetical protein PROFUN_09430 [Planoprotostelium fungivorum]